MSRTLNYKIILLLCLLLLSEAQAANLEISFDQSSDFSEGLKAYNSHDYQQALVSFNRFIKQSPRSAYGYVDRAVVSFQLGLPKADQLSDLNKAISLDSNMADAYFNRGNTYSRLGLYAKAIDDYDYVIKKNPTDAEAFDNRASARAKAGDYLGTLTDVIHCELLNAHENLSNCQFLKVRTNSPTNRSRPCPR